MKNKNLLLIAGIGAAIYFLFCKKNNLTSGGGATIPNATNSQLRKTAILPNRLKIVNAGRQQTGDVNGVII